MKEKYKKLNESFEVDEESTKEKIIDVKASEIIDSNESEVISNIEDQILKDYNYTRGNLYSLIEKGQQAINGILELAQESEMPRAYEVAGQLIKNVGDVADKLMALQKTLKDVEGRDIKSPTNVTNALFVGSTAELSKLLKTKQINQDK